MSSVFEVVTQDEQFRVQLVHWNSLTERGLLDHMGSYVTPFVDSQLHDDHEWTRPSHTTHQTTRDQATPPNHERPSHTTHQTTFDHPFMPRSYLIPHKGITLDFVKEIGRGQFGVARAVKNVRGTMYCLKEVSMRGRGDTSRQQAQKEVNLMTMVREHENIIRIYDHWFDIRTMFILMEYAPNGALDKVIKSHRSDGKRFAALHVHHYLQQLASAIAFLHEERMLHRDLKPENVLVGQLGELKLADFGLSKALSPGTDLCATFVGSPLYMSPEVCMGEEYSFSTDIWALGCIMYEVMTLQSPWESLCQATTTIPALMKQISCTPPDFTGGAITSYPQNLVKTVKWMLRKTPTTRPTANAILELCAIGEPPIQDHQLRDTVDLSRLPHLKVHRNHSHTNDLLCNTLKRQEVIIREAAQLAEEQTRAACQIQKSFRESFIRRRGVFSPSEPPAVKCRPAPRMYVEPKQAAQIEPVKVIQRVARLSMNRRHLKPVLGPKPRNVPHPRPNNAKPIPPLARPISATPPMTSARLPKCSERTERLAIPRQPRLLQIPATTTVPQNGIVCDMPPKKPPFVAAPRHVW
jgi:NIMA (never in mitosis gene a)-related kinase